MLSVLHSAAGRMFLESFGALLRVRRAKDVSGWTLKEQPLEELPRGKCLPHVHGIEMTYSRATPQEICRNRELENSLLSSSRLRESEREGPSKAPAASNKDVSTSDPTGAAPANTDSAG